MAICTGGTMRSLSDAAWFVADCLFPRLKPLNREELAREETRRRQEMGESTARVAALPSDEKRLRDYLEASDKVLEREQARRQSVDARLTSIIGLTSIAATVVFGGLIAQAAGTLTAHSTFAKWVLALGSLYLALQLCISLWAAARGVSRATYPADTPSAVLPPMGTAVPVFLRARINQSLEMLEEHRSVNNDKVSRMDVAHRAMFNFLFGLLLLACAAAYFAIDRQPVKGDLGCLQQVKELCQQSGDFLPTPGDTGRRGGSAPHTDRVHLAELFWSAVMVLAGVSSMVLGAFLWLAKPPLRNVGVGIALTTGGLILSLLGGSKLELLGLKFDNLIGQIEFRLFDRPVPPPVKVLLTHVVSIQPFPNGEHQLNVDSVVACVRGALKPYGNSPPNGWQVIGRVDRRELVPRRAVIYGSNQGLAMARAVWVRDNVLSRFDVFQPERTVVAVAGPNKIGAKVGDIELKLDRAVEIFMFVDDVAATKPVGKLLEMPKPVVCP